MFTVILLIFKILGILLLVILALVLFFLYAVLFVAASYRIQIEKKEALRLEGAARWLFRAVTVRFSLDSAKEWEKRLQVRILGILVFPYAKKKKKRCKKGSRWRERRWKKKETKEESGESFKKRETLPEETNRKVQEETQTETDTERLQEESAEHREDVREEAAAREEASSSKKNKSSGFAKKSAKKIRAIERTIQRKIGKVRKNIASIKDRCCTLQERKDELLTFWRLPEHVRARGSILQEIRYLWKKLRPKKIKGKIRFGWEDPAYTGLWMGGISILGAWYPGQIEVIPDFEHRVLEADVQVKGKVRFYVLVAVLFRVYFNKDIRHMYQGWQQL